MTTNDVIRELEAIVRADPAKGQMECYIYPMASEEPEPISMIDGSISDRVDINGTERAEDITGKNWTNYDDTY